MSKPNISESEWTVMEALWDRAPQTASEVAAVLQPNSGWALNTVRTLLTRLVEKGALATSKNPSRVRQYSPAFERESVVNAESQFFLNRVFKGASQSLLIHFASQSKLSPTEVEQLKQLLDQSLDPNS